jgi:gamma-glutamyl phosphate reductase
VEKAEAVTYDRAAIMRDAHKRFRDGRRLGLGWTFGQCLSTAWRRRRIAEWLMPEDVRSGM